MRAIEFGQQNTETILLLHGGGLSWWNYREIAKLLEKDYHVILPVLDGHADSDAPFTTIEDNAAKRLYLQMTRDWFVILTFPISGFVHSCLTDVKKY